MSGLGSLGVAETYPNPNGTTSITNSTIVNSFNVNNRTTNYGLRSLGVGSRLPGIVNISNSTILNSFNDNAKTIVGNGNRIILTRSKAKRASPAAPLSEGTAKRIRNKTIVDKRINSTRTRKIKWASRAPVATVPAKRTKNQYQLKNQDSDSNEEVGHAMVKETTMTKSIFSYLMMVPRKLLNFVSPNYK